MHLRPSPVDNYGSPSRPTHFSSANRAQQGDCHQYQLFCPLPVASPDYLNRSFPYCVLRCWNSLPVNTFRQRSYFRGLQLFKTITFTLIPIATERYCLHFFPFPFYFPFIFVFIFKWCIGFLGESKTISRRRDVCVISTLPLHPFVVLSHPFSNCRVV